MLWEMKIYFLRKLQALTMLKLYGFGQLQIQTEKIQLILQVYWTNTFFNQTISFHNIT